MENHSFSEALAGPYTASLAARYGEALDYHAVTHPSVPNYLALASGSTWGVTDDSYHQLPAQDIGHELTGAGVGWRAYMESLGQQGCLNTPLPYDPGHNPFLFFGGGCPANVVPFTDFAHDISSAGAPDFLWVTPNVCDDQHSCPVATGDAWLRGTVTEILKSAAWRPGSYLFITWDEDDHSTDNHVLTIVVAYGGAHRTSSRPYDHYSLLATVEDLLGVPRLNNARQAAAMTDLLG